MSERYLITGGAGHLGSAIVRELISSGRSDPRDIAVLAMSGDNAARELQTELNFNLFFGNVTDIDSMRPFFEFGSGDATLIHCAGIVTISSRFEKAVWDVNVGGTQNVIDLCTSYAIKRLVYVSSVHAIPEKKEGEVMSEVSLFDPELVNGLYAKTKAAATRAVLDAAKSGLDALVVHPSGMAGPYDSGHGHITQLVIDFCNGSLTAGIRGGYDFADVRDVASGIISAAEKGRAGECYILSNKYYSIPDLLEMLHKASGTKRIKTILPMWFAKVTAPLSEIYYRIKKQPPLYTSYSMYTLSGNAVFSHEKATRELGYSTRPMEDTLRDTIAWLREHGRIKC